MAKSQLRLFEINQLFRDAMELAESRVDENGVLPDDWADFLDRLQMQRDDKCLATAAVIREMDLEQKAIAAAKKRLSDRIATLKNKIESLKNNLVATLHNGEKLGDTNITIGWRLSHPLIIKDPNLVPPAYCSTVTSPDTDVIKTAIKAGIPIDFAYIDDKNNIQIK